MLERLIEGEFKRHRLAAEHPELALNDLVSLREQGYLAGLAKCFKELVSRREIEQRAIDDRRWMMGHGPRSMACRSSVISGP
jgi:hypothetical protein